MILPNPNSTRWYLAREHDGTTTYRHLALELLTIGAGGSPRPMTETQERLVPFAGPAGHFTRVSVVDVLDGAVAPELLRGRTILIGATATGLGDTVVTPLAGVNGAMPGVEFVANVLDAERAGLRRARVPALW